MSDVAAYLHPVLAVPCPSCGQKAGSRAAARAVTKGIDLHVSPGTKRIATSIERHGPDAAIHPDPANGWWIEGRNAPGRGKAAP
jgi:hypothetical protein